MSNSKEHIHLRFQAVVIASQLPDNTAAALLVLDYARQMVVQFLDGPSGVSDSVSGTIEPGHLRRSCATGLPSSDCSRARGVASSAPCRAGGHDFTVPQDNVLQDNCPQLGS
jgi:hypothetical protein